MTLETVRKFVTADNHSELHEPIVKAVHRGLGVSYRP